MATGRANSAPLQLSRLPPAHGTVLGFAIPCKVLLFFYVMLCRNWLWRIQRRAPLLSCCCVMSGTFSRHTVMRLPCFFLLRIIASLHDPQSASDIVFNFHRRRFEETAKNVTAHFKKANLQKNTKQRTSETYLKKKTVTATLPSVLLTAGGLFLFFFFRLLHFVLFL
jgi:hypothetical protein